MAAGAGVARRELGGELALAAGFEVFGGAEAAVGGAVVEEDVGVFAIDFGAFGLSVGAVGAAYVGAFVPGETEPVEGVEDHLLGGGDEAGAVGVLDAEDELAAALAGVDVVDEADVGGAYVRVAGGRRGDTNTDGGGDFCHDEPISMVSGWLGPRWWGRRLPPGGNRWHKPLNLLVRGPAVGVTG